MRLISRVRNRVFGAPLTPCRMELLERMPKGSVCAEIGVYKVEFSEHILKVVRPAKLHLIDPWYYETDAAYERTWVVAPASIRGIWIRCMRAYFASFKKKSRPASSYYTAASRTMSCRRFLQIILIGYTSTETTRTRLFSGRRLS